MPNPDLTRRTKDNLVHIIRASVGSTMFQHIYVRQKNGKSYDATDSGDKSCAYHTSGVLALVGLIDRPHATVQTTLDKMTEAGWNKIDKPRPGCVVLWPQGENQLEHTGFYLDEDTFVSNSSYDRVPAFHNRALKDGREPMAYFGHPELMN